MQGSYCKISIAYFLFLIGVLCIFGYTPTNDGEGYIEYAKICIAYGEPYPCYPTIMGKPFIWNIGQINLVAFSLWAFKSLVPLLLLMCALKALSAYLIARIAETLFTHKVGLIALLLYVFYPNNWGQSTTILSEIPAMTMLLGSILLVLRQHKVSLLIVAGLLMGFANWFRPVGLAFLGSVFLYYLFFDRSILVRKFGSLLGGYVAFILIVGTSCYLRTGYFIYQSDTLWFNMAEATYETSVEPHYNSEMYPKGTIRYIENREQKTALECSEIWKERSIEWLKDNKMKYLKKVPSRLVYMYMNDMDNIPAFLSDKSKSENNYITLPYRGILSNIGTLTGMQWFGLLNMIYYVLLLTGFAVATVRLLARREIRGMFLPVFITLGGSLALVLAVHGETRFKSPFMPFIFMMAAVCISQFLADRRKRKLTER